MVNAIIAARRKVKSALIIVDTSYSGYPEAAPLRHRKSLCQLKYFSSYVASRAEDVAAKLQHHRAVVCVTSLGVSTMMERESIQPDTPEHWDVDGNLTAYDLMIRAKIEHAKGHIAEACKLLGQATDVLLSDVEMPSAPKRIAN
jgi:hypothetical protein